MARTMRSTKLAVLLAALAFCSAVRFLLQPQAFIQPRETTHTAKEISALGAAVALTASLPAEAFKGPLTGSEVCKSKPLVWFIYPLCDPVFLAAPPYFFPLLFIFYGVIVTTIQLLIPATQPDEDLR
uniref:Alpha-1,3-glucosyltransferase n=1 Tax=Alexandrium monilatum TaxID=311494 RepID=A0A7S4VNZ5_9DINO